jgi:hypothetical protein
VENELTADLRVCFWVLYSVPLVHCSMCLFYTNTRLLMLLWLYSSTWNRVLQYNDHKLYAPNIGASNFIKQMLSDLKGRESLQYNSGRFWFIITISYLWIVPLIINSDVLGLLLFLT